MLGDPGTSALWVARDLWMRDNQRFNVSGLLALLGLRTHTRDGRAYAGCAIIRSSPTDLLK